VTDTEYESAIVDIEKDLDEIKSTLAEVREYMVKADKTISTIADQVMPTIDQLTKSPMLKMLGVKTK
jgi:prefoldin subunit 5